MNDVLDMAAWRAKLRAETQPVEPSAQPMLSPEDRAAIDCASLIYNRALRSVERRTVTEALRTLNDALVNLTRLHRVNPLEAILSYQRQLQRKRDKLARHRGRFDGLLEFGGQEQAS